MKIITPLLIAFVVFVSVGCCDDSLTKSLADTWQHYSSPTSWEIITFNADGTFSANGYQVPLGGNYSISGTYFQTSDTITLNYAQTGTSAIYTYELSGDLLVLTIMGIHTAYDRI